jgi:hypothetical protein
MKLLPDPSPTHIDKRLRAQALHRIFWQGENPIGGPRTDVCPIVAEYYEVDTINNLKVTEICYFTKAKKLSTILPVYLELLRVEVTILIRLLSHSSQLKRGSYRGLSRYTSNI